MALLAKDATPNHRLRAARGRMTQEQEAEALCNLAATKGQHPGINAKMVSNWERGIQTPSKENRALLIEYFGRSAEALGLDQPTLDQPTQGCPLAPLVAYAGFAQEPPAADHEALFGAGAVAGARTREGAATKRRTILKVISGGFSSLVLGRLARDGVHDQIKFQAASTCWSMKVSRAWLKPRQATASGVRPASSAGRAGSKAARPGARTRP
jgi:transcriptional regulator with XRE-family HTH domain